jgi:hypothetical protein
MVRVFFGAIVCLNKDLPIWVWKAADVGVSYVVQMGRQGRRFQVSR